MNHTRILTIVAAALLAACSEQTPESRAEAERNFPQPDESALTSDRPKDTPEYAKRLMRDAKQKSAALVEDAKQALDGLGKGDASRDFAAQEQSAVTTERAQITEAEAAAMLQRAKEKGAELYQAAKEKGEELADKAQQALESGAK